MKSSPTQSVLLTVFALVLIGSLAAPARAQIVDPVEDVSSVSPGVWRTTIGEQHAKLLRSRNRATREAGMQNIITLANLHPGEFDLKPTVPALLNIYANNQNGSHRIMAVAALHAVGDKAGMDELYRLSSRERRSSKVYRVAQNAVRHYDLTQAIEREEQRSAHYLAKGDVKRADRHARRAVKYRSKLGKIG